MMVFTCNPQSLTLTGAQFAGQRINSKSMSEMDIFPCIANQYFLIDYYNLFIFYGILLIFGNTNNQNEGFLYSAFHFSLTISIQCFSTLRSPLLFFLPSLLHSSLIFPFLSQWRISPCLIFKSLPKIENRMSIRLSKNPLNIHPIFSPRTSYKRIKQHDQRMIADMTLNFDKLTINMLKQQFQRKENVLLLPQFIDIARKHLKFWQVDLPNREARLVRYLTFLFKEIDINGNGDMEWQEFTNYIIEKATVLKNLKSKNDEIKHYIKSENTPRIRIDTVISKLEYLSDIDKIAYYEETANTIHFLSADTGEPTPKILQITPKKLVVSISSVKKQKTGKVSIRKKDLVLPTSVRVLDMLYISDKKYRILLVSTSDGYVRGWKYTQNGIVMATQPDNEEEAFEHHFSAEIYCLTWDSINEVLYCGQKSGGISMWNLKTDLEKVLAEPRGGEQYEGEQKVNTLITSMITMPKLQFMASGRMDGRLILWDTINSKKKWVYKQHTRGVLSLAFNQTMILLFSAGFDHKICIWNPYISSLIHKIEGHLSSILSLRVVEGTHQLISMDSQGIVKITDTRRFNIISSFSVQTESGHGNQGSVTNFITINKPSKQVLRLVFGGKNVWFYDYDKNYNPLTADENTVIACRYVKNTLCFFTPAGNKVKVWSALNGDVEKIYMDITSFQISAFDFDFLKKRMIIGDTKGNIALYNTANGAKMKNLTRHGGQITHLIATQQLQSHADIFISCALDNQIRISRETEESFEVVRTIFLKKDLQVTSLKYCVENKLIMVGTNAGSLAFFDIETGKCVGTYIQDIVEEFTSISQACKEIIVTTSSSGSVTLVGIPPFPFRFERLLGFKHKDCEKEGATLGVRLSCFNKRDGLLYVVDDKMYLSCYDYSQLFQQLQHSDLGKEKIEFERRNLIKDILNKCSINLKWQVKAHTQTVKVLEFIEQENILMTSSFDRRVNIWNSKTGEYIDSLQQNYNKTPPEPLAFYDIKKNYLYTKDRKRAFENVALQNIQLDFDPFLIQGLTKSRQEYFQSIKSNKEWNLHVNFLDVVKDEKRQFQKVMEEVSKFAPQSTHSSADELNNLLMRKMEIIDRKRKLMKDIRNESNVQSEPTKQQQKDERKYSTNYFRRSMIKCIQNFVDKNESIQLMNHLKNDKDKVFGKKKHFDYIPIYKMVNQTEKSIQQLMEHKQYVLDLAKKDTESIANSRKNAHVTLSKEESDAANKLYRMLKTTEGRTNQVPLNYTSKQSQQYPRAKLNKQNSERLISHPKSGFHLLHQQSKKILPRIE